MSNVSTAMLLSGAYRSPRLRAAINSSLAEQSPLTHHPDSVQSFAP